MLTNFTSPTKFQ